MNGWDRIRANGAYFSNGYSKIRGKKKKKKKSQNPVDNTMLPSYDTYVEMNGTQHNEREKKMAILTTDENRKAFLTAIVADPEDKSLQLVFADWLSENGDESTASQFRSGYSAAHVAKQMWAEIEKRDRDILDAKKIAATKSGVYTRENIASVQPCYNTRVAKKILDENDDVLTVIVSDIAIRYQGLRKVGKSATVYYRKSSGGKWGRSVQQVFVASG